MDVWIRPDDSNTDNRPQYPYNSVRSFECGHYEEYDGTPGNERIRLQHRSGTYKEYQATGNCVHQIVGNGYHIVIKDQNVKIDGACVVEIMKDAEIHVGGDMHLLVDGNYTQTVNGNYNLTVQGDTKTECVGTVKTTASDVKQQSTGDLTISGNLNVRGDVNCQQTVHALGNLTAGGHLSIQGSIMALGAVPDTGGTPLPHIISGMCPGIGLVIDTLGVIDVTTATAIAVTAGAAIGVTAGAGMVLTAGGTMALSASTPITMSPDIKVGVITFLTHKHGGVMPGTGLTAVPFVPSPS